MSLLEELTDRLLEVKSNDFSEWLFVFPNKRAGLFFQKIVSQKINGPIWSPKIVSIAELFEQLSPFQVADKISLIFKLYKVLEKYYTKNESFEQFYFWGESLLADFEEIDKYLINPSHLFKDLRNVKELDSGLPILSEEQKNWIKKYWESFQGVLSKDQQETLGIWKILPRVYKEYTEDLINEKIVYQGLAYRWVGENIQSGLDWPYQKVIFAGFNALSTAEETLLTWCLQHLDCEVFWDADNYYLKDKLHEAGYFLRAFQTNNSFLSNTFHSDYGSSSFQNRNINVIECSSDNGQAQEAGSLIRALSTSPNFIPERTAIILPNEKLLLPILDAIPNDLSALNVTMGYPLQNSLANSYLNSLLELQSNQKNSSSSFYYQSVFKILYHPFVYSVVKEEANEIINRINKENIISPDLGLFSSKSDLLTTIFRKITGAISLIEYLQECIIVVTDQDNNLDFEIEFSFHFYRLLNNLKDICQTYHLNISISSITKLLHHAIYRERLPFEGEPLEGLQIMGLMETRNLNFDHVILLSAEEGSLPAGRQEVSFLPYALRKAYGLPTVDHFDAIFSYLFYRLIHNCTNMTIMYNSNSEKGNTGEMSRFIKQLEYESKITFRHSTQNLRIAPSQKYPIRIRKNSEILHRLERYALKAGLFEKRFSPSAFNTYLDCSLRFYFRYVLDLYEEEEIEESIQERALGLLFHHAIELTYSPFDIDGKRAVTKKEIDHLIGNADKYIKQAFASYYHQEVDKLALQGQSEIIYEVIKELLVKVLTIDKTYTPFEILGVESDQKKGYSLDFPILIDDQKVTIGIKGVIDRLDKKGDTIRIIDYKTGKDNRDFTSISSLFDSKDKNRNKAVFQTFLYALLFLNAHPENKEQIQAGLFNLKDMFKENFDISIQQTENKKKQNIPDIRPFLDEYKSHLSHLIHEIFNPNIDFVQTADERKCNYCPYNQICSRDSNR